MMRVRAYSTRPTSAAATARLATRGLRCASFTDPTENTVSSHTKPNRHESTRLATINPSSEPSAASERRVPPEGAARPSGCSARHRSRHAYEAKGSGSMSTMAGTPRFSLKSDTARNSAAVSRNVTGR